MSRRDKLDVTFGVVIGAILSVTTRMTSSERIFNHLAYAACVVAHIAGIDLLEVTKRIALIWDDAAVMKKEIDEFEKPETTIH